MAGSLADKPIDVLVVDDEDLFVQTIVDYLTEEGLSAIGVHSGSAALEYFSRGGSAISVVIDWHMPEIDGPRLLQRLRAMGIQTPALFLTGLRQPMYEERGLKLGAVDYIEKSRSFAIILQRIRLVISGAKALVDAGTESESIEQHGYLELNKDSARASWRGLSLGLTLSEFKIVSLLASRDGNDVTYRAIYNVVRGEGFHAGYGDDGFRANVRALIKRIRRKFREVDPQFDAIQSYAGFGYRWDANARSDGDDEDDRSPGIVTGNRGISPTVLS